MSHISIKETRAEINFQGILDKSTERLVEVQSKVLKNVHFSTLFTLISKWVCDGSSGYSTYKQIFTNSDANDEFLFVFSFSPLRLGDCQNINWQSPRLSSTLYSLPVSQLNPTPIRVGEPLWFWKFK